MYTDAHTDTCISIAEKWQEAESSTFFAQHCVLCFPLISAPPPFPSPVPPPAPSRFPASRPLCRSLSCVGTRAAPLSAPRRQGRRRGPGRARCQASGTGKRGEHPGENRTAFRKQWSFRCTTIHLVLSQ